MTFIKNDGVELVDRLLKDDVLQLGPFICLDYKVLLKRFVIDYHYVKEIQFTNEVREC